MKVVFKCEFCSYANEHHIAVLNHEKGCKHNPLNGYCYTCKWFGKYDGVEICDDGFDHEEHCMSGKCRFHTVKDNLKDNLTYAVEIIKTNPSKKKEIESGQLSLIWSK
jgi:hypothetical protein